MDQQEKKKVNRRVRVKKKEKWSREKVDHVLSLIQLVVVMSVFVGIVMVFAFVLYPRSRKLPQHWKTVTLDQVDREGRSGDLVIFSQTGLGSQVTRISNGAPWTHAMVLYRDPRTDVLYIWEMCSMGTRLIPWRELRHRAKELKACWRPLIIHLGSEEKEQAYRQWITRQLQHIIRLQWNLFYDDDVIDISYCRRFIAPLIGGLFSFSQSTGSTLIPRRTCAHLVSEVLQGLQIARFDYAGNDPALTYPLDYAQEPWRSSRIPLVPGRSYATPFMVSLE